MLSLLKFITIFMFFLIFFYYATITIGCIVMFVITTYDMSKQGDNLRYSIKKLIQSQYKNVIFLYTIPFDVTKAIIEWFYKLIFNK